MGNHALCFCVSIKGLNRKDAENTEHFYESEKIVWRFPIEIILLIPVLMLAGYLRFTNVGENPHWYADEATHINIAQHLAQGRIQYMAIKDSTILFARPPLFHLVLSRLLSPEHDGMLTLRRLTAGLGVISVLLLYIVVRRHGDGWLALLAAFAFAVYPQAVLYSRMGYSYNLAVPLILLTLLGLSSFAQSKRWGWLALASIAAGLAPLVDLTLFNLMLPLALVVILSRRPLHLLWSLPLAFAPFALFTLVMLVHAPEAFIFDVLFTLTRLSPNPNLDWQINNVIHNYSVLISQNLWFPAGLIGLFVLRPASLRWVSWLLFLLPLVNMGRIAALYNLSAHYMIPLLPFVALGVGAIIRYGAEQVWKTLNSYQTNQTDTMNHFPTERRFSVGTALMLSVRYSLVATVLIFLIGVPLWTSLSQTADYVQNGYWTDVDPFLTNPWAAREVARYVNANSNPDDVMVTTPVLNWMVNVNTVDYQTTAAAQGRATPHLPPDIAPERFAFDPSYENARYVVVDPNWYNWGVIHVPGVDAMLRDIETWPLVFQSGELKLYQNPAF